MANAKQVDFLLQNKFYGNSVSTNYDGIALASGYLKFWTVGKTALKTIWKDALKAAVWVDSKITLNANGIATDEVYADGAHAIEVYDADDILIETIVNAHYSTSAASSLTRVVVTASSYAVSDTGAYVESDSSSNSITLNLLTAAGHDGEVILVIKTSGSNTVTIDPSGSETVSGLSTITLTAKDEYVVLRSNNVNWAIESREPHSQFAVIADSATPDIFNNTGGDSMHLAGTTTVTDFPDAPRSGMIRRIYINGSKTFTHGSGITILGAVNWAAVAGDWADVYADTVSAFTLTPFKTDGTATAVNFAQLMNLADNIIQRAVMKDYGETISVIGSDTTPECDLANGNAFTDTIDTGETTFTFSNPPASGTLGSFTLVLTNGGSQTVNWPAAVDWGGGSAPALTVSGVDILGFMTIDGGTIWYGFAASLDNS